MRTVLINIIIQKAERGSYFGRANYRKKLFFDNGNTIDELQQRLEQIIKSEVPKPINGDGLHFKFNTMFDLPSFFNDLTFINISKLAKRIDISPGLLQHYATGVKYPSQEQLIKIQNGINSIGEQMRKVVFAPAFAQNDSSLIAYYQLRKASMANNGRPDSFAIKMNEYQQKKFQAEKDRIEEIRERYPKSIDEEIKSMFRSQEGFHDKERRGKE